MSHSYGLVLPEPDMSTIYWSWRWYRLPRQSKWKWRRGNEGRRLTAVYGDGASCMDLWQAKELLVGQEVREWWRRRPSQRSTFQGCVKRKLTAGSSGRQVVRTQEERVRDNVRRPPGAPLSLSWLGVRGYCLAEPDCSQSDWTFVSVFSVFFHTYFLSIRFPYQSYHKLMKLVYTVSLH